MNVIRILIFWISIFGLLFAQRPADQFLRRVYYFDQDSIQYRLFVPKEIISSDSYPLILTLHGSGEIGNDNNIHIIHNRVAETWAEDSSQQKNPSFVFSPQVPPRSGVALRTFLQNTFLPRVDDILDSLINEFPIDTSRLYITGYSLGSQMTWGFIYRQHPNRFAAAIPMSGGVPQVLNELQITQTPIWAFHGDQDNTISVQTTRDMMSAIENAGYQVRYIKSQLGDIGLTNEALDSLLVAGVNHIYTEYEGAGHDIWSQSYDDPILHRWLFSQTKESSPVNVESQPITTVPPSYRLYENYPNPFNPRTRIKFELSKPGKVTLKVFNLLGKEIRTLVDQFQNSGSYSVIWDGKNGLGRQVASGIYLYRMQVNGTVVQSRKMALVK
jgi:dienelactone hydrolase